MIWKKVHAVLGRSRSKEVFVAYLFIAPVIFHLLMFTYFGIIYSGVLSAYAGTLLSPFRRFVGLGNYRFLFTDDYFLRGILNTLLFCLGVVPIVTGGGLCLALFINQKFHGRTLFRVAWYLPVVTSIVAAAQIWIWMYNVNYGLFNDILRRVGLPKLAWIYSPKTALMSIMLYYIWQNVAFSMIIYLASLQEVPMQLYEAAQIDGANAWGQFFEITLPLVMPATFFLLIVSTINALKVFVEIRIMTGGGPLGSTTMTGYQIYEAAFDFNLWGRASAMAVVFFFMVLFLCLIQYRYIPESYV